MRITHKKDTARPSYLLGKELQCVEAVNDLGVLFTRDLSCSKQVAVTVNKANKVLGIFQRTVVNKSQYVFSTAFESLVILNQ